jgi:hypothetical protein
VKQANLKEALRWLAILNLLSACAGGDAGDVLALDEDELAQEHDDDVNLGSLSQALCSAEEPECEDIAIVTLREPIEDGREELSTFTGGSLCRAYRDRNFRGASITLQPGSVYNYVGDGMNDAISSIRLPPGCELAAWPHRDQRGSEVRFYSDVGFVGPRYNDAISSFACACRLDLDF